MFSQLIVTVPGAVAAGFSSAPEAAAGAGASADITASVNGLPWAGTTYTLDGVSDMELLNAFETVTPSLDALQEVKASTANSDATVGVYGGAQVNAVVKSGTNKIHGSAYEFFRDDALNAIQWHATSKAPDQYNEFGTSIGGPIIRNKAFYFGDYQGLLINNGEYYTGYTVPTDLMKQGYFLTSQFPVIYDPKTGAPFPIVNSSGGPAYQIPVSRFDPVAALMVGSANIWPEPTNSSASVANYTTNNTQTDDSHQFDAKVDYQFNDTNRIFARESYQHRDLTAPSPGTRWFQIGNVNAQNWMHNAVVGYDRTFSATSTNEFRFGFNRFYTVDFGNDFGIERSPGSRNSKWQSQPVSQCDRHRDHCCRQHCANRFAETGPMRTVSAISTRSPTTTLRFWVSTRSFWAKTFAACRHRSRMRTTAEMVNSISRPTTPAVAQEMPAARGRPGVIAGSPASSLVFPSSISRGFVNTDPATRANLWGNLPVAKTRIRSQGSLP